MSALAYYDGSLPEIKKWHQDIYLMHYNMLRQSSKVHYSVPLPQLFNNCQPAGNLVPLNFYCQHLHYVSHESKTRHFVQNLCCMFNLNVQVEYCNVLLCEYSSLHKPVNLHSHAHKEFLPDHVRLNYGQACLQPGRCHTKSLAVITYLQLAYEYTSDAV